MKMNLFFVSLVFIVHQSFGVIYRLNGTEYERMPPLIHLDEYEKCFYDPDALYCTTEMNLVSDTPSDLYNLIRNYSDWTLTHYDHTNLYHGVCVTRFCNKTRQETLMDLNNTLEACLNNTLWTNYKLKVKLSTVPTCYTTDDEIVLDYWDIFVAIICASIIIVNIIATFYDLHGTKKPKHKAIDILLSFSILHNWSRLHQSDYRCTPPMDSMKGIDGVRAIIMILLIIGHSFMPYVIASNNPQFLEQKYHVLPYHLFINGSIIVQAYFFMSGLLLSYNTQRKGVTKKMDWNMITSNIFKRWLRLTPTLALILAITSTWLRFLGSGPLWQITELKEITDCRRYWLWNLMYLANYKNNSHCMPQTWYVAADMHLYCFGIFILVLVRNSFWRNVVLAVAFMVGLVTCALPAYLYNLDAILLVNPKSLRQLFINEPSFDHSYKPSHVNIPSYVIGLAGGILVHHWQKNNFDLQKYKKYVGLYWFALPCCFGLILLNGLFYMDGPQLPLYIRLIIHTFLRPAMSTLIGIIIIGMTFKMENIYRCVLEWDGWVWIARVSYSAYITHLSLVRLLCGNSQTLYTMSNSVIVPVVGITMFSFLAAVIIWLMLENPVNQIVKICLESSPKNNKKMNENNDNGN